MTRELTCEEVQAEAMVERYLAGTLTPPDEEAFESHYLTCERCQSELKLGAAVRDVVPSHGGPTRPEEAESRRRWRWAAVLAVAAAVIALLLLPMETVDRPEEPVREGPPVAETVPEALAPRGRVSGVDAFRWTAVEGTGRYRVTIYDEEGSVLLEEVVQGTTASLPDTVRLTPGEPYFWKVEARIGFDRWRSSPLQEFSLGPPG